jgi:hypothetical protein
MELLVAFLTGLFVCVLLAATAICRAVAAERAPASK